MDDKEYNTLCEKLFDKIESFLDANHEDLEYDNNGEILEIAFDDRRKIVVSRQRPLREVWLADRSGGFHFRMEDDWIDTRSGDAFMTCLKECIRRGLEQ